jgi:hypothetical protein
VTRPPLGILAIFALSAALAGISFAAPALAVTPQSPQVGSGGSAPAARAAPGTVNLPAARSAPVIEPRAFIPPPGDASFTPGQPLTPAAAASAVSTCTRYATRAGWANNGYYSGDLVTAAAICVAESAGNPLLYVCDSQAGSVTGHGNYDGKTPDCPSGTVSYDRGLWQLNSKNASSVSDSCAFTATCNAGQAYLFSQRGTDFEPWTSYDTDTYSEFIDLVQAQVTKLTTGTVTSAELGECLVQQKAIVNYKVEVANCGSGAATQQWVITGGKLRAGSLCAAIGAGAKPGIVLRKCGSSRMQSWSVYGRDELRDAADGKCLTDPGGSLTAGTQVDATSCTNAKDQTWWLP